MKVIVAEPDRPLWQGEAEKIVLPLRSGNVVVLEQHAPMVALLKEGELVIFASDEVKIPVKRGIVSVRNNQVDILVR